MTREEFKQLITENPNRLDYVYDTLKDCEKIGEQTNVTGMFNTLKDY